MELEKYLQAIGQQQLQYVDPWLVKAASGNVTNAGFYMDFYVEHAEADEQIRLLKAELDFVRRGHDVIGEWYG